jgi:hypothetical protein
MALQERRHAAAEIRVFGIPADRTCESRRKAVPATGG